MILRRLITYSNTQNDFAVDMLDCTDENYHFKGCVIIPYKVALNMKCEPLFRKRLAQIGAQIGLFSPNKAFCLIRLQCFSALLSL